MGFLERLIGRGYEASSRRVAKERLRLVLAHDRASLPPGLLDTLKDEIITVISRHIEIDADDVEVTFSHGAQVSRLVADIPLKTQRVRRKR
jgi:cell division topological specificity factor